MVVGEVVDRKMADGQDRSDEGPDTAGDGEAKCGRWTFRSGCWKFQKVGVGNRGEGNECQKKKGRKKTKKKKKSRKKKMEKMEQKTMALDCRFNTGLKKKEKGNYEKKIKSIEFSYFREKSII